MFKLYSIWLYSLSSNWQYVDLETTTVAAMMSLTLFLQRSVIVP